MIKKKGISYKRLFLSSINCSKNIIFILTKNLLIKEMNDSALYLFGTTREDAIGKELTQFFQENQLSPPLDLEKKTYRSPFKIKGESLKFEFQITKEYNEFNELEAYLIIGSKIKEISQTEFTSLQLENVVKYAPGLIYCKDFNSTYQWCNDEFARLGGLEDREQVIGKTDYDLAWKERAQLYIDVDKRVMESGIPKLNHEEKITISDNSTIIVITNKVPLFDQNNNVVGLLGITIDITNQKGIEAELRMAKEKAEIANHAKTEFIANVSHDIRTPLTGIIGFSEYLKDHLNKEENKEIAESINLSGVQLLSLLNGVLEVVSVDNMGEEQLIHQSFDLPQLITDLCQLEQPAIEAHNLQLFQHMDKEIPRYLVSDKMKLHRILLNLIGNAIKFTEQGSISLEVRLLEYIENKVKLKFSVIDTGIGIPLAAQSQVFDRFYKVSSSYKGKFTGNGIGLHIVQKYIHLLGGDIQFNSIEGKGTTFSFFLTLPIGEEVQDECQNYQELAQEKILLKKPAKPKPVEMPKDHDNKPHVLLVEDNAMALRTLKLQLKGFDVVIHEAVDAEAAFELIKQQFFDLIITDIGLPGISGNEMVELVRQFEKDEGIEPQLIIGLTGHAVHGAFGQTCLDAGINKLYQKPMQTLTLKELIQPLCIAKDEQAKSAATAKGFLGIDLPDTEAELFTLNQHPIFDLNVGAKILGSEDMAIDLHRDFRKTTIGNDLNLMKRFYEEGDWMQIEQLSHKIKGGACYGTVRLYYALLYMERYLKAGHKNCVDELYNQMLGVIDETVDYLERHL